MTEQWIAWHPKAGDIKPERYRYKYHNTGMDWAEGDEPGAAVDEYSARAASYQIPAPVVSPPADRPPWIDPQCKFRWGDRVKVKGISRVGSVAYVINPNDLSRGSWGEDARYTVLIASSLAAVVPYETAGNLHLQGMWLTNYKVDRLREDQLELFPEDLPQHFDDRLLDADQPQEQPKTARVPREIWVSRYPAMWGPVHITPGSAARNALKEATEIVHFREVL